MNKKFDQHIIRGLKQLAQKECANYDNGSCLLEECPCHAIQPAYQTVHDGTGNCDYCIFTVLPQQPELNTAVWHEIFREEGAAGEGWKECVCCHKPFIPGSNRQRYCVDCGAAAKQIRIREKQRRYRERQKVVGSVTL